MTLSKQFLVLLSSLLCSTNAVVHVHSSPLHLRSTNIRHSSSNGEIICRVTIKATALDAGNGRIQVEEDVVCIKQVDEEDSSTILSLADLPAHVYKANQKQIVLGRLYMSLTGITVDGDAVTISDESEFTVFEKNGKRKLEEEDRAIPIGEKTLAIVRISTSDAHVTATAAELENTVLAEGSNASNIMSQFRKMSFGQLVFRPKGVYNVYIDQSISLFTGLNISQAAEIAMVKQLGLEKASDLADRVFFCVPPGLQKGFIAFTFINYWRATFSDTWCHSLSATIHEVGHTFGLGHSHWEEPNDYQDLSCYMGLGGGLAHAPRQTFNAHKGWQTGWYAPRHLAFDPFTEVIRRIEVAALVDYETASDGQAVIVNVADHIYFQYNRARGFNNETRSMPDKLVVVEAHGNGNSGRIAALGPSDEAFEIANFLESGQRLVIEVCREEFGNPDIMVVSIGFGESTCSTLEEPPPPPRPRPKPAAAPIRAPTRSPRHAPAHAPTTDPSSMPTITTSKAPSPSPISRPSLKPSAQPTVSSRPSAVPSTSSAPSFQPTGTPSSRPSLKPSAQPTVSSRPSAVPSTSSAPSFQPTGTPSSSPSLKPSAQPTVSSLPSAVPSTSSAPSFQPTGTPSSSPSLKPSAQPTVSSRPSAVPSTSSAPSFQPTGTPSSLPSLKPSAQPTVSSRPTGLPSSRPTLSRSPSSQPSTAPSVPPSLRPSLSTRPSLGLSEFPSESLEPSTAPSTSPRLKPTTSRISPAPTTPLPSIPPPPPSSQPSFSPTRQPATIPSSRGHTVSTPSPSSEEGVSRADDILKEIFESFSGSGK
jgi:Gametolysin peptidase M11